MGGLTLFTLYVTFCFLSEPACLWTLTALQGTFSSPYYPQNYNNRASCKWYINVPWNFIIALAFDDFTLQRQCCMCDYVEVWETYANGSSVMLRTFCDDTKPDSSNPIRSTSNNMLVIFQSDGNVEAKGFNASYEAIKVQGTTFCVMYLL